MSTLIVVTTSSDIPQMLSNNINSSVYTSKLFDLGQLAYLYNKYNCTLCAKISEYSLGVGTVQHSRQWYKLLRSLIHLHLSDRMALSVFTQTATSLNCNVMDVQVHVLWENKQYRRLTGMIQPYEFINSDTLLT